MNPIDEITKLKQQGKSEQEIANTLNQQGISPKQITDALGQAQVKSNVPNVQNQQEMQPSIMPQGEELEPPKPPQQKAPQEEHYTPPQESFQDFQSQYSPQGYEQDFYQPQEEYETGSYDADTMIDIAEQVLTEKMAEINKQLGNINELKTLSQTRINHIEKRLEKIESIIDKLQIAILQKIGSYGENLNSIKNEMGMMQDSFGKMVNPIVNRTTTQIKTPVKKVVKKTRSKKHIKNNY